MFREVLWKARNLRNYTALWYRTSDLLDREKRGYGEGDDSPLYEARRASILLLDDLGVERVTDWVREQIDLLIDGRYSACLPTIMTSNLSLSTLAKPEYYGSRVTSRIQQTCDIIAIRGGGLRSKAVNS
jgi:DNA replication protein DnaC